MNRILVILTLLCMPFMATAQFSNGSEAAQNRKPAWEEFKLPNKTIKLNFRNANVDLVLDLFMKVSGVTIVKDPALKEPMTISSPNPVTITKAFEILNANLSLRGYELKKEGTLLMISKKREQNRGNGNFTPEQLQQMMGGNRDNKELKVYQVDYAAASEVARVINEVFQMQQQSNNPFVQFGGGGRRGRGGFNFNAGGQTGADVRASSDDFSNSVIVYAARDKHYEVEDLISTIDKPSELPQSTKVYPLEFADATQLVAIVQNVLTSTAPTGRGANAGNNVSTQQRFGLALRTGSFQAGFGTVVADTYTNSLVITATAENHAVVESVVKDLDKDVQAVRSTFVLPLANARAEAISEMLNNAFAGNGRTNRNNFGGGFNFNRGNNRNRGNNNRNNRGNNRNGGGFGRAITEEEMASGYIDLDLDEDEIYTDIYAQQGGFFFGGGQNQGGGQVRGADGRLQNSLDLQGQVTIIPDPNTNSLIVITSPENMQLLQDVLQQLDRVPEQVMIETLIVEATLDKSTKMGVEWNFIQEKVLGNNTGTGTTDFGVGNANPAGQGIRYTLTGNNFSSFLNALQSDDKFQVLSTPRIFTSNNVEAEINISQSVPYVLSTREDTNGNLTFNYAFQDVGIVLTVTPQISANGMVTLDVTQTANDLQGFTDFNAPIVNQRQASTTVSVLDGNTVILGGIMRTTVTSKVKKLPILGDIPILGELFKSTDRQNQKTELLVFLTPRVVRNSEEAEKLRKENESRMSEQSQKAINSVIKPKEDKKDSIKTGPKQKG